MADPLEMRMKREGHDMWKWPGQLCCPGLLHTFFTKSSKSGEDCPGVLWYSMGRSRDWSKVQRGGRSCPMVWQTAQKPDIFGNSLKLSKPPGARYAPHCRPAGSCFRRGRPKIPVF